jgi:hypothetical protein
MQYWPNESRASSHSYTNPDYETSSEYSDPSERRPYRYVVEDSCAIEDDPSEVATVDPMAVSESTKLKGVYWPGMDIFDSATPEMRRKRNQKKDSSVVEQLELNSQEVEPTELIFTPTGSFKRQRRISSSVIDDEEDSPIKTESPRPVLRRQVLANLDVNVPRRSHQVARPTHHNPYSARHGYDDDRSREDFGYGYGDRAPKRKRVFDVYQDDDTPFSQPSGFNYLTAGLHQQPSPTPAPSLPTYKTFGASQYENKENVLPALHPSAYEHHHAHQPSGYYHAYAYGLEPPPQTFQYNNNNVYMNSAYEQQNQDDDDNRTITAPPSPSTG